MAGLNIYNNIPGMPVEFKDGGTSLKSNNQAANTKSMLILGTAEDGPVMEPVAVDINTVKLFGKSSRANGVPNNSTLVKDFEHAWNIGCRDIRLMRITGQEASCVVKTADSRAVNVKKVEETKGIIGGNDETVFTLVNTPISGSVKVYCKGAIVVKGWTISGKTLTIGKNACDAGATISVSYSHIPVIKKRESFIVKGKTFTLAQTPNASTLKVLYNNSELILTSDYTIAGKVVTIVSSDVIENDVVEVEYEYTGATPVVVSENNNDGVTYITEYTNKSIKLSNTPTENSVRIYVASKEVSNVDAFTITNDVEISIDKKYFSRTDDVAVSYLYEEEESFASSIKIQSSYGGEVYNQSRIVIETISDEQENYYDKIIKITKPESKKLTAFEEPLTFKSSDYPTFMSLVNAINSHRNNNVFKAFTDYPEAMSSDLEDVNSFLSGGDSGLNCTKQEIFDSLAGTRDDEGFINKQGAYQILENYVVDFLVPGGVYADDYVAGRNKDFAYELSLLCAIITNRTKTVLGAIAMKPCSDTSLLGVQKHTNNLMNYSNTYPMRDENGNLMLDSDGNPMDLGRYIHVVIGPEPLVMNSELGVTIGNPAVQYIAELTLLPSQSSPLNKNLHSIKGLRFNYQTPQIDKLLDGRYIMFNTKLNKAGKQNYKMVDGVTCAFPGSEYARTTTLRCLQEIVDEFRDASEAFFGEPPSIENRNALASAISKRKDALINQGTAEDISFQLIVTPQDYLLGQATLEVDVIPPKEFRKINMVVGLKNTI